MTTENNIREDIQEIPINKLPILTIIYENEKYNDDYLNIKIQEAKELLNSNISTCIIKNVLEEKYKSGFKQYYITGYVVAKKDWEYYSDATFIIKDKEAEYIKEIKAELYKYHTEDYSVGTDIDLIV